MTNEMAAVEEEGGLNQMEEAESGAQGKAEGRASKLGKLNKLQTYHPLREVLALEEIRIKYLRQGIDLSRSRLVSEAIKLLSREVNEGKFEIRG